MPPCLGLWLTLLALPQAAAAQAPGAATEAGSIERARQLFEQGLAHAQAERWAEAAEAFKQARAISARPSILFNLASVLYRLGSLIEARQVLAAYSRLLRAAVGRRNSSATATNSKREDAGRLQILLDRDVPTLSVRVDPAYAWVIVDGATRQEQGTDRAFILDPGEHHIEVRAWRHVAQSLTLTLAPGERRTLTILLSKAPALAQEQTPTPTPPPEASAQIPRKEVARWSPPPSGASPGPAAAVEPSRRDPRDDDGGLLSSPVFWVAAVAVVGGGVATTYLLTRDDETTTAGPTGGTTGIVLTAPGP